MSVLFAFAAEAPTVTVKPVLTPEKASSIAVPDGRSHTVKTPLDGCDPLYPQRTARLLNVPLIGMRTCCRDCTPGLCVQDVCDPPAPKSTIVLDERAGPAQKACAMRTLDPAHPAQCPLMVRSFNVVTPVAVNPLTMG
jgi:hypothetical protein